MKMFFKCLILISKEWVITVGNKSISISTPFHFETIWIRDLGALRGIILNNQMNLLITLTQAIGHKIPDLETFSRILQKSGNKNDEFLRKLIIGNLVGIKICYSSKPAKPFQWPKIQVPKPWYSKITLIDTLGHVDRKLLISREPFEP